MIRRSIAICLMIPLFSLVAAKSNSGSGKVPMPKGFDGYMVFMSTGGAAPDELFGDGYAVMKDFMGFSQEKVDQEEANAKAFFMDKFGITQAHYNNGDVAFSAIAVSPDVEYRAYTVGGGKVHKEGWPVRDVAFMITVLNPSGLDLGGEFAGTHVAANAYAAWGWYNIVKTKKNGKEKKGKDAVMVIQFEAACMIEPAPNGMSMAVCDLYSEEYGVGVAHAMGNPSMVDGGLISPNVRNILTFNPNGGL